RARVLRRPERHRRHPRAGDPPSRLLLRRDPQPLRDLPAGAARLEGAGARRAGGGHRRPGARGPADHDRRRLQPGRALRRRPAGLPAASTRGERDGGRPRDGVRAMNPSRPLPPASLDALMRQAYTMEIDARVRYTDLADAMETHNNREVAALFRKMAEVEARHAAQILAQMGWPAPPPPEPIAWDGFESPETIPVDEVHYLMRPWHALALAMAGERRAERFFSAIADTATDEAIRAAAI